MTYWFFYSLELLLLLAGLAVWSSLAIMLGKTLEISAYGILKTASWSLVLANLGRIGRIMGILGLGLLMGIPIGRKIEGHERDSMLKERYNVTILSRESPRIYRMRDSVAGEYQAVFCEDENFAEGERLKVLKYLKTPTCWQLKDRKTGNIYAKQGENEHGWNSNANAVTVAFANPQAR